MLFLTHYAEPLPKTEDVAKYLVELCEDARKENVEKLFIVLDNNSTHKEKMKRLLTENLKAAEIDDKILIEFIHTPAYGTGSVLCGGKSQA